MLVTLDARTDALERVRSALGFVVGAVYFVADSPYRAEAAIQETFAARIELLGRIAELERDLLRTQGTVLRYEAVLTENSRLRELFGSRARLRDDVVIAEVVAVSSAPAEIVIDKGHASALAAGLAVVDSTGLLGQIVETSAFTSRVLLITDPSHAVPVRVLRNDVRAIAAGAGAHQLMLKDVAVRLDIREGDQLVSSGLGGRFPNGYPVGSVASVAKDYAASFASIVVKPRAALDRSGQVLVVLPGVDEADLPELASELSEPTAETSEDGPDVVGEDAAPEAGRSAENEADLVGGPT